VCLVADARDEVLERDDGPVLADDDGDVGRRRRRLGERLVLGTEHADVRALCPVVATPQGGEVCRAGEVVREVDAAVALAALPDERRVRLGGLAAAVDDVGVGQERRHVDRTEVTDAAHVVFVDQYPVCARLDGGRDPSLSRLPVPDAVVGFHPDRACHYPSLTATGLENCGRAR